jgi:hypothetical protein
MMVIKDERCERAPMIVCQLCLYPEVEDLLELKSQGPAVYEGGIDPMVRVVDAFLYLLHRRKACWAGHDPGTTPIIPVLCPST